ncbi:MAG: hypothetical protein AAGF83_25175 [Cyanobacteria bacterium P01_G01_bin.67]
MIPSADFTVGNTITVAVAIYKQNWKRFLKLSFIAHLWLLVPVYGWARYFAISAWLSKLSLDELTTQFNSMNQKHYLKIGSLFLFFITALIVLFLTLVVGYLLTTLLFTLVSVLLQIFLDYPILDTLSDILNRQEGIAFWLLAWSIMLFFSFISAGLYIRLFVTDLSFSAQPTFEIFSLIRQSFVQTKKDKLKVFKIILMSFVLSFSLYLSSYLFWYVIAFILYKLNFHTWQYYDYAIIFLFLIMSVITHGLIMPFWQSIKAVTFYKLVYPEMDWSLN